MVDQTFLPLSLIQLESTGNICDFFLWLISNTQLATAVARSSTCSGACAMGRRNGLVWWCAFKRRPGKELLVAE
jgi:hypothetical protein